jgi:uncharacterized membrane protein YphA (DoxX/SURF4 family)
MISLVARGLLVVAGFVAGWFVSEESPNFGLVQIAVGLILLVFVVWVVAFWPKRWTVDRRDKKR